MFTAKIINQKADTREVVNIPDQNLKNFLLTYFKKNKQERMLENPSQKEDEPKTYLKLTDDDYIKPESETEIYKDEMEKIVDINIIEDIDFGIKDLTGLEKAINMVRLMVTTNKREEYKIESIEPLRNLTKLNVIHLEKNKISSLEPLSGMNQLYNLSFGNNKIENIEPLRGKTNLHYLYLGNNNITNVDVVRDFSNLEELDLGNSKINNLDFLSGLTKLNVLRLNRNEIENIDILRKLTN